MQTSELKSSPGITIEQREGRNRYQGTFSMAGINVNIFAPFGLPQTSSGSFSNMGIPECVLSDQKQSAKYCVLFREAEETGIDWYPERKIAILRGKSEELNNGSALVFTALSVTEYVRQMNSELLTHGAAVRFPNGKSIIVLGNQGDGKTTLCYHLCKYLGCELIGNDQVIFGLREGVLTTIGGTKYITVRKTATSAHLKDLNHYFDEPSTLPDWKIKKNFVPEDLGLKTFSGESEVAGVIWIHLDYLDNEEVFIRRNTKTHLVESLNLTEKLARHINGGATPIVGNNGLLGLSPSFDTPQTIRNRNTVISTIYEKGFYSVNGGNLPEILEQINKIVLS
jgi:hypothetical protein